MIKTDQGNPAWKKAILPKVSIGSLYFLA